MSASATPSEVIVLPRAIETPVVEDKEASLAELVARVDVAIAYVKSLGAAKFEGAETREIKRKIRGVERTFTGSDYLFQFALPNFYFHVTTAYAILRHNGVELGKRDFIGVTSWQDF